MDYLVESGFKSYLIEISEGLRKRGCNAVVGNEYQSWNSENTRQTGNQEEIHWIEFNGKKEIIFEGIQRGEKSYLLYFNKLIELIDKTLKASKKEERVFQITSYDGVFICILTHNEYLLLKEICKPLKNKFVE
jgi:hypothetical protein